MDRGMVKVLFTRVMDLVMKGVGYKMTWKEGEYSGMVTVIVSMVRSIFICE